MLLKWLEKGDFAQWKLNQSLKHLHYIVRDSSAYPWLEPARPIGLDLNHRAIKTWMISFCINAHMLKHMAILLDYRRVQMGEWYFDSILCDGVYGSYRIFHVSSGSDTLVFVWLETLHDVIQLLGDHLSIMLHRYLEHREKITIEYQFSTLSRSLSLLSWYFCMLGVVICKILKTWIHSLHLGL